VGSLRRAADPRPLGPLLDIAREAGGELAALAAAEPTRHRLFGAFLDLLDSGDRPVVAVVEDAHWPTRPPWTCSSSSAAGWPARRRWWW
jgi:hypothetical protein